MSNEISKTKIIHSNRLAGYLLLGGCKLISIIPNLKNALYNVYIFLNNSKLQKNISDYMEWSKKTLFLSKQHLLNQFDFKITYSD